MKPFLLKHISPLWLVLGLFVIFMALYVTVNSMSDISKPWLSSEALQMYVLAAALSCAFGLSVNSGLGRAGDPDVNKRAQRIFRAVIAVLAVALAALWLYQRIVQ